MARRRRCRRWSRFRADPQPGDPTLRRCELMSLRRHAARRRAWRRTLLPAGVAFVVLGCLTGGALALFAASATLQATVSTGTWGSSSIKLSLGNATAPHSGPTKPDCPKYLPIASLDGQGSMSLDFGDQKPNSSAAYGDVFRITSLASTPLTITFSPAGAAASLVQAVSLQDSNANTLAAQTTQSVAVTLLIPQSTTPGKYSGQLIVGIRGSSETYTLPLVINVVGSASVRLAPGAAKAPHANASKPNCPTHLPIASVDAQGTLTLDFGDQKPKTSVGYSDVFRITSLSSTPLKITFTTSGAAAALIQSVCLQDCRTNRLPARATRSVAVKLVSPRSAAPGQYMGQLVVGIAGSPESYTLPIVVNVPGKAASPAPSAPLPAPQAPAPSPTETPTPTPTPTPGDTPSPTPSDTPSPTPSDTPSPTPSDTPSPTPSDTPSPSSSPSDTPSESPSPTPTTSPTDTPTPSATPSATSSLGAVRAAR